MIEKNPPELSAEQKSKLSQRLALPNRSEDRGLCPPELAPFKTEVVRQREPGRLQEDLTAVLTDGVRLLLPAWPHKGDDGDCEDEGLDRIEITPGRFATSVFSDLEALAAFDASARPVPASSRRIAVNVSAGSGRLVFNPGPHQIVLPAAAVNAIATGDKWLAPWKDSELKQVLSQLAADSGLGEITVKPQADATLIVGVTVLDYAQARHQVAAFAASVNANEIITTRCDSIQITPLPAN